MASMSASPRGDDRDDGLREEVRQLRRAAPIESLPPETSQEIASLTARVEAVEASTRTLTDALRELRGLVRNLNRSGRYYRLFRS